MRITNRQQPKVISEPSSNVLITPGKFTKSQGSFFCARPWTGFEVEENGEVKMCCWAKENFGNVNDQTISEIWNGSAIKDFRLKMARGDWADICKPHCPILNGYTRDTPPPEEPQNDTFSSNLKINLAEIAERKVELKSLPRFWKITHSTFCNLDCIMCYQDRKSKHQLPASFYYALRQYYSSLQELLLIGGEPLIIKDIKRLMNEFPTVDCPDAKLALITNGTIFDSKTMALAARVPLSWVSVSIDAAKPETYARIRKHGILSRTLEGVKAWKKLSEERDFFLVLSFTVMRDNVRELADFVELSYSLEVDCGFMIVQGTKAEQHLIDERMFEYEVERALHTINRLNAESTMPLANASLNTLRNRKASNSTL